MLKGKRLLLRPVQKSDVSYLLKWHNDPELIQFSGNYLPVTEMEILKRIEDLGNSQPRANAYFIIEATEEGKGEPIGETGLRDIRAKDRDATLFISIGDKTYWGKGYGKESAELIINYGFEQLNLHRISSSTFSFNERSIKMHLRLGFKEEGRRRDVFFKNGDYCDEVIFGLLRE